MSQTNKCKLACRKTNDYYDYLANEYISKHTCPCPGENECISTCVKVIVTPEILNERRSFTAALTRIRHDVLDHADRLGLFSKLHPHPTTLDHVRFLSRRLDAVYWKLAGHLDAFRADDDGSKRLRLRKQIEKKISVTVENLKSYEDGEQQGRSQPVPYYGGRSSCYSGPCNAAYMRYVNDLLDVFSEQILDYVRELKEERKTMWQKIWS